jgi:hypothetical protein
MTRFATPASRSLPFLRAAVCAVVCTGTASAGYKDDIGWTKLAAELGGALPNGAGVGVSQVEAPESAGNFGPNTAAADFTGKTFTLKSGPAGNSGHATLVAGYYYGLSGIASGVQSIDLYEANNWIGAGFLKTNTTAAPATETRSIQSHSWVAPTFSSAVDALRRLDFAIQQDEFLAVVGLNNGNAGSVPALLAGNYNGLSVGLTNGGHSYGTNTADGAGRTKPELVAPESFTSFSTPMVSATAAMLHQVAPTNGRKVVALKSILLAGATKTQFPGWSRTTTRPVDTIYGAGQVNAYRSYHILNAGEQNASGAVSVGARGWDLNTTAAAGRLYFFDVPAGNTASDFSVLLTWNRVVADGNPLPTQWSSPTSSLANLTLKLYAATGFAVGSLVDSSESTVDNIEHIYRPLLAPGRYALEVTSPTTGVEYGVAWYSQPTITVAATTANAAEAGLAAGSFTFTRAGDTTAALTVAYTASGTATAGSDYQALSGTVTFPAASATAVVMLTPLADSLAEGTETATLTIAPDVSYSAGTAASATVNIADNPGDAWRFSKFTSAELADVGLSGDEADFDGDGIRNLMEYALGLEPKTAVTAGLPTASFQPGGELALSYTRVKSATDITYIPEVGNDLGAWNSGVAFTSVVQTSDNGATETITVKSLIAPAAGQFMRLRVTRP